MPAPINIWHINANGWKGTLNITADAAGNLSGTIDIDIGISDTLQGVWSETTQEISFYRMRMQSGSLTRIQTYTGYLFKTKESIFRGRGAPEPNPDILLLTGYFEDIYSSQPPRFGWVARQDIP